MSKQANPTLIGIFVICGLSILVGAIILLGSGQFFSHNVSYIAFFSGSVKGLKIGSPVRFRGAEIGKVTDIRLEIKEGKDGVMLLPVTFDLSVERINHIEGLFNNKDEDRAKIVMQKLITDGVKASLAMDSIVTAQLYIDLDYHENDPIVYQGETGNVPEIPTIRSPFEKISSTLEKLPIDELVSSATNAIKNLDKFLSSDVLTDTLNSIEKLTNEISSTVNMLNDEIPELSKDAKSILKGMQSTLKEAEEALESIKAVTDDIHSTVIDESSPVRVKLYEAISQIEETSRSLQNLSEFIQRNPETVIFGKSE